MPKSLADLKAKPKSLPTRTVRICLDQEAVADVQRLDEREVRPAPRRETFPPRTTTGSARARRSARARARAAAGGRDRGRARRAVRPDARVEGDLLLRAIGGGEWQRFKDDNPAREGNKSDEDTTYGLCDSTALLADLGRYVVAWDGENLERRRLGRVVRAQVAPADLRELCSEVVQLHEAGSGSQKTIERLVRHPAERERLDLALALGVSPRRLLGWEPEERHEHYDADGNLTGYTVVTRDPEFDDGDLERLLALRAYEAGVCACGIHESLPPTSPTSSPSSTGPATSARGSTSTSGSRRTS
jgi:hypothetical protein